jgi:hypothetical protein
VNAFGSGARRRENEMRRVTGKLTLALMLVAGVVVARSTVSAAKDKPCNNLSDACLIEVANTYMDAQAGGLGTPEDMRLAPTAIRWENARITGATGEEIRARSPGGAPSNIYSQRDRDRVWVDGNQVFSRWEVDVRDPVSGVYTRTAQIFERIQIDQMPLGICGDETPPCVTEVEAIFVVNNVGLQPALPEP